MGALFGGLVGGTLGILYLIAGPVTYIICVVDTWSGSSTVVVKLLVNLTIDAFLAFIWPLTWIVWLLQEAFGGTSPIEVVFG